MNEIDPALLDFNTLLYIRVDIYSIMNIYMLYSISISYKPFSTYVHLLEYVVYLPKDNKI